MNDFLIVEGIEGGKFLISSASLNNITPIVLGSKKKLLERALNAYISMEVISWDTVTATEHIPNDKMRALKRKVTEADYVRKRISDIRYSIRKIEEKQARSNS